MKVREEERQFLQSCSLFHYQSLNMDEVLAGYQGKLKEFVEFLNQEWGWIVEYEEQTGVILADENKPDCVCPLKESAVKSGIGDNLCFCSEGFAKRMFSKVLGCDVTTKVVQSILRGGKSCVYQINIPAGKNATDVQL